MRPPAFSSAARACLALVLALPMLAGCGGGAAVAEGPRGLSEGERSTGSGVGAAPSAAAVAPSFMRVGEITQVAVATAGVVPPPPPDPPKEVKLNGANKPAGSTTPPPSGHQPESAPDAGDSTTSTDKNKPRGGVQGAVVDSASGLSETDVRATIVQGQGSFRACYDLGSQSAASAFEGTVSLRASIGPSGVVASVEVLASTTRNVRVDTCVADAVRRMQFPSKGGSAVVAFPIAFGR